MEKRYQTLKIIVEKEMQEAGSAHDIDHVMRVYNLCLYLARDEPHVDYDVLKISVLLHDVARVKEDKDDSGNTDHAVLSAEMAEEILRELDYSERKIGQVKHCIATHRFRSDNEPKTKEAKILFDADKLDVIGAIGVARCFIIAGQFGERIHSSVPIDDYIKENLVDGKRNGRIKTTSKHAPNIEFETKFKYIPDKLYTLKAKELAKQRIKYMEHFFERLKKDIKFT
jgi:uncharacterized protein